MTRPEIILRAYDARHPGMWRHLEKFRSGRDWPDWCYVPVAAAASYIARETMKRGPVTVGGMDALQALAYDAGVASTLAAWRMGRGLYRFDADFSAALTATPLSGDLPVEVLYHLPEWAVYVEMDLWPVRGFFAALEWDSKRGDAGEAEMRLFFDVGDSAPTLLPLPLTATTIADMLEALWARIRANAEYLGAPDAEAVISGFATDPHLSRIVREALPAALNLLIYLCSPEAEYRGSIRPERPAVIKTKRGERLFPASAPRVWRLGESIGARLRAASAERNLPEERNAPRPHLRRAHWHTYRVGKGRAGFRPRWLHPILVGYKEGEDGVQGHGDLPGDAPDRPGQGDGGASG